MHVYGDRSVTTTRSTPSFILSDLYVTSHRSPLNGPSFSVYAWYVNASKIKTN